MNLQTVNGLFEYTATTLSLHAATYDDLVASANDYGVEPDSDLGVALRSMPGSEVVNLNQESAQQFVNSIQSLEQEPVIVENEVNNDSVQAGFDDSVEPPAYLSEAPPPAEDDYGSMDTSPVDEFDREVAQPDVPHQENSLQNEDSTENNAAAPEQSIVGDPDQSEIRIIKEMLRQMEGGKVTLGTVKDQVNTVGKNISEVHPFKAILRDDISRLRDDNEAEIDVNRYLDYKNVYWRDIVPLRENQQLEQASNPQEPENAAPAVDGKESKKDGKSLDGENPKQENDGQTNDSSAKGGGFSFAGLGDAISATGMTAAAIVASAWGEGKNLAASARQGVAEFRADRARTIGANQTKAMETMKTLDKQISKYDNLTDRISNAQDGPGKKGLVTKAVKQASEINENIKALSDKNVVKALSKDQKTKLGKCCEDINNIGSRVDSEKSPLSTRLKDAHSELKSNVENLLDSIKEFIAKLASTLGMRK